MFASSVAALRCELLSEESQREKLQATEDALGFTEHVVTRSCGLDVHCADSLKPKQSVGASFHP